MAKIERFANNATTTLDANIASNATSFTVTDGSTFPARGSFRILIDSEILAVGYRTGNTFFGIERALEGTTALGYSAGTKVTQLLTKESFINTFEFNQINNFILSFDPNSVKDASGTTLYAHLWRGNKLGMYFPEDTDWRLVNISGINIGLPTGVTKPYDSFVHYNSGDGSTYLSLVPWNNDTQKNATSGDVLLNGVRVRNDDNSIRYLGSIYISGGMGYDTPKRRLLYNHDNKLDKNIFVPVNTASWSYAGTGIRDVALETPAVKFEFLVGVSGESNIECRGTIFPYGQSSSSSVIYNMGLGLNRNEFDSQINGHMRGGSNSTDQIYSEYSGKPPLGMNFINMIEASIGSAGNPWTIYGASQNVQCGLHGRINI